MNLSMNWLADYVSVKDVAIRDYCEKLTYTGSKVEGFEVLGDDIENVVVAKVTAMEKHPDSDHLWICQMNIGNEVTQIVTGAQNVHEGDIVPAAIPVAHLPGEVTIKAYDADKQNTMMRDVSSLICFSDCDDTFWVVKIIFNGREVEYVGWMPQMRYRYRYVDTGDLAWEQSFPQWDH